MRSPQEALELFADKIEKEFERWYDRHEVICRWSFLGLQLFVFLVSIATALIAALSDKEQFGAWGKYVLVILPLLASIATTLLSQLRLYDLWKLREEGRIKLQDLAIEARRRAAGASDDECKVVHAELQKRLNEIETAQSTSFFGLFSSDLLLELRKKPVSP